MKKAVIIIIAALLFALPALIVYFSMQASTALMQQEHEQQLKTRLQHDLVAQNEVTNPVFEISQYFSFYLFKTAGDILLDDLNVSETVKKQLCDFTGQLAHNLGFLCQSSVEYQYMGKIQKLTYENDHKVSGNPLEKLTGAMRHVQQKKDKASAVNAIKQLADYMSCEFRTFFNLYFIPPEDNSAINRIVLREPDSMKLLITLRARNKYLLNSLFDLTAVDDNFLARRKAASWKNSDSGLILFKNATKTRPICSRYFSGRQKLVMEIMNAISSSNNQTSMLKLSNHMILLTPPDPKRPYRLAITARLPAHERQPGRTMLLIFFAVAGCSLLKLVVEIIIFNRGRSISLKTFIILTFIIVTLLPFLSAIYLSNEYVVSNFKLQKNQVAEGLAAELLNMDLATFSAFRESINRAKGFNSIESLQAYTGLPESAEIEDLATATLNKLLQENGKSLFSEIWIFSSIGGISGVESEASKKKYRIQKSDNVFINEIFEPRYRQYFLSHQQNQTQQPTGKEQIKFDEVKGEVLDSVMLNLFGEKTYYRLREDFGSIVELESCFDSNSIISVPVTHKGKVQYIFSWVFSSIEFRNHFPLERLNIEPGKPINFNVFGTDKLFNTAPGDLNQLSDSFPTLMGLARQSHLTATRRVMQDMTASGSLVFETRPARYSDFILCGQRETRSLESISNELTDKTLSYFSLMALTGLLFALLTSLYFSIPIRQLTEATREIIAGRYSIRLTESHPDEFAIAAGAFNKMATALAEGQLLRHFVSDSVKALSESSAAADSEKAGIVDATILFSSIQNFSELQHQLDPEKVFAIMQAHLSASVEYATAVGGEIDKMIEDKVMIVFTHKSKNSNGPTLAALQTATHISEVIKAAFDLNTAAGINSGEVVSGVMGATNVRLAKTVIGDTVNLAARLASVAANLPGGGIVISGNTAQQAGDSFIYQKLPINNVKGKTHAVSAYLAKKTELR